MKTILETLGLKPETPEAEAVAAIKRLKTDLLESGEVNTRLFAQLKERESADKLNNAINRKIAESGGALNREQAAQAIANQAVQDSKNKKK